MAYYGVINVHRSYLIIMPIIFYLILFTVLIYIIDMSLGSPVKSVKTDSRLQDAEKQNWGPSHHGPLFDVNPWEGKDACGYGTEMDQTYWNDMPIDSEIMESHKAWVSNRKEWSGTSKYLQESIEPTVDWIGIKPGGIGPPEPVPQSCNREQLTEYGPSDFSTFITQQRRRCGNPVVKPSEMANEGALPFSYYGF